MALPQIPQLFSQGENINNRVGGYLSDPQVWVTETEDYCPEILNPYLSLIPDIQYFCQVLPLGQSVVMRWV